MNLVLRSFLIVAFLFPGLTFAAKECDDFLRADESQRALFDESPEQLEIAKELELSASQILRQLKLNKQESRDQVHKWIGSIQEKLNQGQNLSVMEHTTLQLVLRTKFLEDSSDLTSQQEMEELFVKSWYGLTGEQQTIAKIVSRPLPKSVLAKESIQIQRFHELAYKADPTNLRITNGLAYRFATRVWPVALIAVGLAQSGADALAGAAMGYFLSLTAEYSLHRWYLHALPETRKKLEFVGFNKQENNVPLQHEMHHREMSAVKSASQYARHGADDFTDPDIQNRLVPLMNKMGLDEPGAQVTYVEETRHGTKLSKAVRLAGYLIYMPIGFALGWWIGGDYPLACAISAGIFSTSYIHFINFNHPDLHEEREPIMTCGSTFEKWYVNTQFFRAVSRFHYLHHARSNKNFNLMPGGIDWLMGTLKDPDVVDILNMMEADLIF